MRLPVWGRSEFPGEDKGIDMGTAIPVYNARVLGAQGDGSADDTTAVQQALTLAGEHASRDARVAFAYLPAGRYVITRTLTVPSWVYLLGAGVPYRTSEIAGGDASTGRGTAILIGGSKDFHMLTGSDSTNGNTTIRIEGIEFDQRGASGDVDIIRLSKAWRTVITNCYFRGGATTNRRAVTFRATSEQARVRDCRFEGCGIYVENTNAVWIVDNEIGVGAHGINIATSFGSQVVGNHLYNCTQDQIRLRNANGTVVSLNHLEDGERHGIAASAALKNSVISGNVVKRNSASSAGTFAGINIDSDTASLPSEYNVITGNLCYDDDATPTQGYGIKLASFSGSQTNNNRIADNVLWGNTTAQYSEAAGLSNSVGTNVGHAGATP